MSSNICFDLTVLYQYHLKGSRLHVQIIEDYEIDVNQQALNQLRNNNNTKQSKDTKQSKQFYF
jgi:hypothetical protein